MKYVYLIQSILFLKQKYTGITTDVFKRLEEHNSGKSIHTSKYKPWKLVTYIAFTNEEKAMEFERYLKSGSGRAFAENHFRDDALKCSCELIKLGIKISEKCLKELKSNFS